MLLNYPMKFCPRFFVFLCLSLLFHGACIANGSYDLVISKSSRQLEIMDGDKVIRRFNIAYGKGGKGTKRIRGDEKTPVGVYKIVALKKSGQFHYFMQIDYPNLLDAWYGYKNNVIDASEFKSITNAVKNSKVPPQNTKLGGYIGIHGIGGMTEKKLTIHRELNWTNGCIALTNEEIDYLKKYVGSGTKVVINE